jgi:hypothetical protein
MILRVRLAIAIEGDRKIVAHRLATGGLGLASGPLFAKATPTIFRRRRWEWVV